MSLAEFHGRPLVLVFGSFTCNLFCGRIDQVSVLARAYEPRVAFAFVYVRDAGHPPPTDGPMSLYNPRLPAADRRRLIGEIWKATGQPFPCLYGCDSSVADAYHAFPLRLVVIDSGGRLAYDTGPMPSVDWDFSTIRERIDAVSRVALSE